MESVQRVMPAGLALLFKDQPLSAGKVRVAWRAAVGPALDRATTVRLLTDGVLDVAAVSAQWSREVERSRRLILSRLETLLGPGVVADVVVRVRP